MNNLKKVGAVILAAGESKRMMQPKAFLPFNSQIRFIDKIIMEFQNFGCLEIVVVVNNNLYNQFNLSNDIKLVINTQINYGRFYSLKIGLQNLNSSEYCYVHNVDNPFVTNDVLNELYHNRNIKSCIVPTYLGQGGHPILLGEKIIQSIISEKRNDLNIKEYLRKFDIKKVEVNEKSVLTNINTADDYRKYVK